MVTVEKPEPKVSEKKRKVFSGEFKAKVALSSGLPIRHQPFPLRRRQRERRLARRGPHEPAPVQPPLAQPHPVPVPHQQFQPRARLVPEDEPRAGTRRPAQPVLDMRRQPVGAPPHVHRLDHQPQVVLHMWIRALA